MALVQCGSSGWGTVILSLKAPSWENLEAVTRQCSPELRPLWVTHLLWGALATPRLSVKALRTPDSCLDRAAHGAFLYLSHLICKMQWHRLMSKPSARAVIMIPSIAPSAHLLKTDFLIVPTQAVTFLRNVKFFIQSYERSHMLERAPDVESENWDTGRTWRSTSLRHLGAGPWPLWDGKSLYLAGVPGGSEGRTLES